MTRKPTADRYPTRSGDPRGPPAMGTAVGGWEACAAPSTVSGAGPSRTSRAVLTIADKSDLLRFSAANYTVAENGGSVLITVNRLGSGAGAASV